MAKQLLAFHHLINRCSDAFGRVLGWSLLLLMLVMVVVVALRYVFDFGSIALQESTIYLHAMVFMLGAGYTLKDNEHVRVDVFYRNFSPRKQAWVDLFGGVFLLLPVCIFLLISCWQYVMTSWQLLEGSPEAGGLPLVFVLKTALLLFPGLLMVQGLSQIALCLLTLLGVQTENTSTTAQGGQA
ncbi:TRAP transporter small permease subunit [Motilimonas pumila]|uniref:TRAP transporter small permease protein n=1 Tax=Motilimonas pumila TaxID=2303987 RepID=A0A418YKB0_9GAMM|nr:TRAP transporter small permease subunit [Motilimonas pumila]RJG51260.1 TRAP transporter small permease subunit [Motilimonas pumila]